MSTAVREQDPPTRTAIYACADWLKTCLDLGWRREDLDVLEDLWWKYYDRQGRLTSDTMKP